MSNFKALLSQFEENTQHTKAAHQDLEDLAKERKELFNLFKLEFSSILPLLEEDELRDIGQYVSKLYKPDSFRNHMALSMFVPVFIQHIIDLSKDPRFKTLECNELIHTIHQYYIDSQISVHFSSDSSV